MTCLCRDGGDGAHRVAQRAPVHVLAELADLEEVVTAQLLEQERVHRRDVDDRAQHLDDRVEEIVAGQGTTQN